MEGKGKDYYGIRRDVDKGREEEKGRIMIEKGQEVDKRKYQKSATK